MFKNLGPVLVWAAAVCSCGRAWAGDVPTLDFARSPSYGAAKISPNGDYLGVESVTGEQTALLVIDLKTKKPAGGLRFPRGEHVADFWWVGPKRVVVAGAQRYGPLDQPVFTGELLAMDADGRNKTILFGYRAKQSTGTNIGGAKSELAHSWVVDPLPEDPEHAIISVWPWSRGEFRTPLIYRIDVNSARLTQIAAVDAYAPIQVAVAGGKPLLTAGLDSQRTHKVHRRVGERWEPVALQTEKLTVVGASKDGSSGFLIADDGKSVCLREVRIVNGQLGTLACHDEVDAEAVLLSTADGRPTAVFYEAGLPTVQYLDPDHEDALLLQSLAQTFPGERVHITSRSADGRRLVVQVDSDRNPGDIFVVDLEKRSTELRLAKREWIDPQRMQPMEAVQYKARDGVRIHGYLTRAATAVVGKPPLVLMPHGGPHGIRDYWRWDPWVQFLSARGFAVLQVNYRGSGGYGFRHQSAGYRRWGTLMQDDLTDAVRWAIEQGIADPQRVCIVGGSYGGYAALQSAVREPDLYRCAAGMAGVYDLVRQAEDSDIGDHRMGRIYLNRVLGDDEIKKEQSPVTHLEKLKIPVLIAHGTADRRVPFSQAELLRKALDRLEKPYEWLPFKGEEHGFYEETNHVVFLDKLAAFLERHIGQKATAPADPSS